MTVPKHRAERLADQIRGEVAGIVESELKDLRVGFATVTPVDLSADFCHARVFVSVMGRAEAQEKTLRGLPSAEGFIRRELGRRLRLRRLPEVIFVRDHGAEEGSRIEEMLKRIKNRARDGMEVRSQRSEEETPHQRVRCAGRA